MPDQTLPASKPGKDSHIHKHSDFCSCNKHSENYAQTNFSPKGKGLDTRVISVAAPKNNSFRKQVYRLRNEIGKVYDRVFPCGRWLQGNRENESFISAVKGESGKTYFSGLQSCNSVWVCPFCALKISAKRREEIVTIIENAFKEGKHVVFVTLTRGHTAGDRCKDLKQSVSNGYRKMTNTRRWDNLKDKFKIEGYVKNLECTIGENGFHPHNHCLFILPAQFKLKECDRLEPRRQVKPEISKVNEYLDDFGEEVISMWMHQMEKEGIKVSRSAQDFQKANSKHCKVIAEYLSKWDIAAELTQGNSKKKGKKGKTPFQVFQEYLKSKDEGKEDKKLLNQFLEFADAFEGARQLTFSKGLKKKYLIEEKTDEELCKDEKAEKTLFSLEKAIFKEIKEQNLDAETLIKFDENGGKALVLFLAAKLHKYLDENSCDIAYQINRDVFHIYLTKVSNKEQYGSALSQISSTGFG